MRGTTAQEPSRRLCPPWVHVQNVTFFERLLRLADVAFGRHTRSPENGGASGGSGSGSGSGSTRTQHEGQSRLARAARAETGCYD